MQFLPRGTAALLVVCAFAAPSSTADAQRSVASNTLVASSYVFRGLTLTNVPTVQPKLTVSQSIAGGTASAFAAGNVEFRVPTAANALSEGGGVSGVNELDLVAQFSRAVGPASVSVGATRYEFSRHNRVLTSDYNTTELFLGARADKLPGTPSITANWDVQTIHGLYLEAAAAHSVKTGPFAPVFGVAAGYSLGQEEDGPFDQYFNFAQRGLTHVDASVAHTVGAVGLEFTPNVHVQFSPAGQNTRVVGALPSNGNRSTKLWFGIDIAWSHESEAR